MQYGQYKQRLEEYLEENNYFVFTGTEIFETLRDDYDEFVDGYSKEDFKEWILPVKKENLEENTKYIVNSQIDFEPIRFDVFLEGYVAQQKELEKEVTFEDVATIIEGSLITKVGAEHSDSEKYYFEVKHFEDVAELFDLEEVGTLGQAYDMVYNLGADPLDSFFEVQLYDEENHQIARRFFDDDSLITQKEIADFLNRFLKEEIEDEVEIKKFKNDVNRNLIIEDDYEL